MSGSAAAGGLPPMVSIQEEIVREMADLQGPLEKYEYLLRVARALEVPEASIRKDAHAVPGCQAQVWIRAELREGRLHLVADSDAMITRGMIALLVRVLDGRTPAEILDADLFFLERTGLEAQLSPSRANGLAAMVQRIRTYAQEASAA